MSKPDEILRLRAAPALLQAADGRQLLIAVQEAGDALSEKDALAVLAHLHCTTEACQLIAQNRRLTSFSSIRLRLVAHRATPQAEALRLLHFLYWPDLLRLSIDVRIPATVRVAIDRTLLGRVAKLALGERVTAARGCGHELAVWFLFDQLRVFESLLTNPRLREDDLLLLINSSRVTKEKLVLIGSDRKWSQRYPIRKALVLNAVTPRATAASQLRFLSRRDLTGIYGREETSIYLRRCIERLQDRDGSTPSDFSPQTQRIE